MASNLADEVWPVLRSSNISEEWQSKLVNLAIQSDEQDRFSKPMPWIGIYIMLSSLVCILEMVADFLHGLRNRKLWIPCKRFKLNALYLFFIAIVVKLPMDLNNAMPGDGDQAAKLGSMSFLCIVMANLLPSLATMDKNQLFSNVIALGFLVITLVVNVCIQIYTGVISRFYRIVAIIFVVMLLMLLLIYICSSLAILKSKEILESKYQAAHETILKDQQPQQRSSVEELKQHVTRYLIMAATGNPQFMTICSVTTTASGVLCVIILALHIAVHSSTVGARDPFESDYDWSMLPILIMQTTGVLLGTAAPLFRCFATLRFKLSLKWFLNHLKIFKVERYWTRTLFDWKNSSVPYSFRSRRHKTVIDNLKILILDIIIGFQMTAVLVCKMIALIPIFLMIFVWCCYHCWKLLKAIFISLGVVSVNELTQQEGHQDLSKYVLQLQNDMEFAERTLKRISKSLNRLTKKAEKQQPKYLLKLIAESRGFDGVGNYGGHHVRPSEKYLDCWSLSLVTLTTIAISLPNIQKDQRDRLLRSVSEGLTYVTLVEESLNATNDHVSIQKAAKMLWLEVELHHKWLGNKLKKLAPHSNQAKPILQWFKDTSEKMIAEESSEDIGDRNDSSIWRSISADSMHRFSEMILSSYNANIEQVNSEQVFAQLSSMIADILSACLTNLPQVIAVKCHASAIEKREASVNAAAQTLGETMHIINTLEGRKLPRLNPDEMAFIEKWAYHNHIP